MATSSHRWYSPEEVLELIEEDFPESSDDECDREFRGDYHMDGRHELVTNLPATSSTCTVADVEEWPCENESALLVDLELQG